MTVIPRREPPPFRSVEVSSTELLSPRMLRITLAGEELDGFDIGLPAASVRLLLPRADLGELVIPNWDGNEFLFEDGRRPPIRTLTPLRFDPGAQELEVQVVLHGTSPLSDWARSAGPGTRVAVSGTGRGYQVDTSAEAFLLAGDETALPAISLLLKTLPEAASVEVHVEIADPSARLDLPSHPGAIVRWHDLAEGSAPGDALVPAVSASALPPEGGPIWVAGEAAAVQRIRRHLFEERGLPRDRATIRGYWKRGRAG